MTETLPSLIRFTYPDFAPKAHPVLREQLGEAVFKAWGESEAFLETTLALAPYLARTARRYPDVLLGLSRKSPQILCEDILDKVRIAGRECADEAALMAALRQAKAQIHLILALSDLGRVWDWRHTTALLSDFADACVEAALVGAARFCGFELGEDPANPIPGYFILALGKHGTRVLNYSSDIDLVILFEPEVLAPPPGKDPAKTLIRVAQRVARYLQEVTAEGYVFRVDLRLRPDPSSTPVALSADSARNYFEALGQNWERAAYAKARVCAGDKAVGEAFLEDLTPFIWRRSLDYAAVEDIHALARQIQAVGDRAQIQSAGHDVKLGRGGIREIEFYCQVLQLVFGGRKPDLRVADPLAGLWALQAHDLMEAAIADLLSNAYSYLRDVEHRIQMLEDEQTQTLPREDQMRARVAAMMGEASLAGFDAKLVALFQGVHGAFSKAFSQGESLATDQGSLVLTGVEPTPDTLDTLRTYGFSDPERVWQRLSAWAAGKARAVRTERARGLFSRLAPRLVEAIGASGDPDATFIRFSSFLEGLPAGVQPLSLLANQPELADELIIILGLAPRLAERLSRRPSLLDVMLEPSFTKPVKDDVPGLYASRFDNQIHPDTPFEEAMNIARRITREERFRIGTQVLRARTGAGEAGAAFADLADAGLDAMARAAEGEMARRHGPAPGQYAVVGLGKFGGRELSADSDLDLMVIYDPQSAYSDGDKPLDAERWFTRFTQRLVSALSAPTEEGRLYEVDMALRPSGSAGPIAVRLSGLRSYYEHEAWTWERMAMTRARVVSGSLGMAARVEAVLGEALDSPKDPKVVRADAWDMRQRLLRDKPAYSDWDLKLRAGGMIDIEFIAQVLQLSGAGRLSANTYDALGLLHTGGTLRARDVEPLKSAYRAYASITQLMRVAHGQKFDPEWASEPFKMRLAGLVGAKDLNSLKALLDDHAQHVHEILVRLLTSDT
ncbi:bifunctional [glutamine synthetase] adenylyltransferase/[glutamine synthetase]-adenylyl-L-tyrosine phosphorylase [Woodsholea maritima]|uniref:bifunctional [glutamine synthetase] adenylyltransferase/[glutamine synthetase]-adenylyl-L-tyrosine phosphorylase n=1 Tax=Woodsholea maritima TaxID=240237 RepID=UPI00036E5B2F|nr:bifunctional [glutamine synthetase] adenylyltransferase/[glutamine synthetase]-adenylyl-L-tyrosine phosphorylase [Woodsholea maritima]